MISALPLLLADHLAAEVTGVALPTGLFTDPCRGAVGDVTFAADADEAAVFVQLGALDQDAGIGARADGEEIRLPFTAEVDLALAGPETTVVDGADRDPADTPVAGADLMLSVVTGHLNTARDAGRNAPLSRAETRAEGRKLAAEWRFGQIVSITPDLVADRVVWRLKTQFEGVQTLSPLPAEGGHIARAEIAGQLGDNAFAATIQGSSNQLPLALFVEIGPENAERLASFGLARLGDLMRVPRLEIAGLAAEIARDDDDLRDALTVLHAVLMLRLDAVLAGVNAAFLFERHAALTLDTVWDGQTLTLPDDMRTDQQLRFQVMAAQLMRLVRPEDRARVTLGQLTTLDTEAR
ncbi:hypothetical protein [Yoonia sp. SS1-5]|uniref:Uncharacterized protein n=1 Tax=Yoonia rhodophyticola TaxID=3137370 RepID=A0AAN0MC40_9RHOB